MRLVQLNVYSGSEVTRIRRLSMHMENSKAILAVQMEVSPSAGPEWCIYPLY